MSTPTITVDKLVATYLKIRAKKAELEAAHKTQVDELEQKMDQIKAVLLEHCKVNEVDSVRTADGTFFRTIKTRYWTNDWPALNSFIVDNNVPEFFEKRLNQSVVKQYLEDNGDSAIPGLQVDSEYVITVRKAT